MEHERTRFSTMNLKQLFTRLNRITKEDKLRRFIAVAMENQLFFLAEEAGKKLAEMTGLPVSFTVNGKSGAILPPVVKAKEKFIETRARAEQLQKIQITAAQLQTKPNNLIVNRISIKKEVKQEEPKQLKRSLQF